MTLHAVPDLERFTSQDLLYLASGQRMMALASEAHGDGGDAQMHRELAEKCERMAALITAGDKDRAG